MSKVNNQSHHNDVNGTVLVFLLLTRTYITYCYVSLLTLLSWLSKNKVEVKIFLKLDPYWHLTMLSIFHFTQTRFVDVTLKTVTLVYVHLKERDLGIKTTWFLLIETSIERKFIVLIKWIWTKMMLNLFFQMFPFDPIKNVRKPNITCLCVRIRGQEMLGCLMFERKSKGKIGRKMVKNILLLIRKSFGKYQARI